MLEELLNPNNYLFSSAIFFICIFFVLEVFLLFWGIGVSQINDAFFENTPLEIWSSFFLKRKIPVIIFILLFCFFFGFIGLFFQFITKDFEINQYISSIFVFPLTILVIRYLSIPFSKISIKDETSVVSKLSFIGETGVIILGVSKINFPTEAKFIDVYGREHYFLVEPLNIDEEFNEGDFVIIIEKKSDSVFSVIKKHF